MKNLTLIPILLPTEDASQLFFHKGGDLCYNKTGKRDKTEFVSPQYLYLCSTLPIKDGDWCIDNYKIGLIKANADNVKALNMGKSKGLFIRIEFTTNTKLIAEGVLAMDGNTTALIDDKDISSHIPKMEVPFLSEYCNRYNQKDNQKTGIAPTSVPSTAHIGEEFQYKEIEDNQKGIDVERLGKFSEDKYLERLDNFQTVDFKDGVFEGYNQALQKARGFSLEDMRKAMFETHGYKYMNSITIGEWIENYLQSLTKETPKGDIIIELIDGNIIFKS